MRIRILRPGGQATAELQATPTSEALWAALPIDSNACTWGDVYFDAGLSPPREPDAAQVVDPGTVAFWTDGDSLALPFGPTPISHDGECRLASPCNLLGAPDGDPAVLRTVRDGDATRVERA